MNNNKSIKHWANFNAWNSKPLWDLWVQKLGYIVNIIVCVND